MLEFNQIMVRVRIAPSPTGLAHVGTGYTALFNYAFVKQQGGKFILRIEDTDAVRSQLEFEKVIFDGLRWLNLNWDEGPDVGGQFGPYRQSERKAIYQEWVKKLVDKGLAYEKEGAVYLKVPLDKNVGWQDLVRGEITFPKETLKDFVIQKSDGFPVYNLACVIDDHLMEISHVIRAEDHISNTPRQILIYQAFGWPLPHFAHLPLLRNPDHSKISKRKNPVALDWYREQGYLPEAVSNFFSLLGWSHPEEKDLFPIEELIKYFSFKRISKSAPIFDFNKLNWLNGAWIRNKTIVQLIELLKPYLPQRWQQSDLIEKIVPLVQERIKKLTDFKEMAGFFFEEVSYNKNLLMQKGKTEKETGGLLQKIDEGLARLANWQLANLQETCLSLTKEVGWSNKDFFMCLRVAMTGKTATPPLLESMEILGKEKCLQRLQKAIEILS